MVTATHGRGKVQKVLIGSVAEEIFRQADCAVLTVGPRVKDGPPREVELKNILFATDFGHGAEKAAAVLAVWKKGQSFDERMIMSRAA